MMKEKMKIIDNIQFILFLKIHFKIEKLFYHKTMTTNLDKQYEKLTQKRCNT